jgi:hypothetical protein
VAWLCSLIFPDGVVAIRELEKAITILANGEMRSLIIDESLMSLNVTKLMAMIPINEAKQRLQDLIDAVSQLRDSSGNIQVSFEAKGNPYAG